VAPRRKVSSMECAFEMSCRGPYSVAIPDPGQTPMGPGHFLARGKGERRGCRRLPPTLRVRYEAQRVPDCKALGPATADHDRLPSLWRTR
jgi:hypothetical protein